jgi:bla regulator protein blaR1
MSIRILGLTLLHFLWQGALIGLAAVFMLRAGARRTAHERYLICLAALLACAVVPCVTAVLLANISAVSMIPRPNIFSLLPLGRPSVPVNEVYTSYSLDLPSAAVVVWVLGLLVVGSCYAWQLYAVHRIRLCASPFGIPRELALAARRLLARWLPEMSVRVMLSDRITAPIVIGVWRPLILFPAATLARMRVADFELILLHEIGHIVRRDAWVNSLQVCLEIVFFYHPVLHWLSRRARFERECACDDFAVAASGSAYQYAQALTALALSGGRVPRGALGAAGADLLPRLRYLAREHTHEDPSRNSLPFALLAGLLCGVAAVGSLSRWEDTTHVIFARPAFVTNERPLSERVQLLQAGAPSSAATIQPDAQSIERPAATAPGLEQRADVVPQLSPVAEIDLTAPVVEDESTQPRPPAMPAFATELLPDSSFLDAMTNVSAPPELSLAEPGLVATFSPLPDYPPRARLNGTEGTVSVLMRVAPDGRPAGLQILRAEPLGVFEGAVRRALMRWRFEVPPTRSSAAGLTAVYELRFSLAGISSTEAPGCATPTASNICGSL